MIESYELRLKNSMVMYNVMLSLYFSRLGNDLDTFTVSYNRLRTLTNLVALYNVQIRKAFALQNLDCDSYPVEVIYEDQPLTLIFSHAIIKVQRFAHAIAYQLLPRNP